MGISEITTSLFKGFSPNGDGKVSVNVNFGEGSYYVKLIASGDKGASASGRKRNRLAIAFIPAEKGVTPSKEDLEASNDWQGSLRTSEEVYNNGTNKIADIEDGIKDGTIFKVSVEENKKRAFIWENPETHDKVEIVPLEWDKLAKVD